MLVFYPSNSKYYDQVDFDLMKAYIEAPADQKPKLKYKANPNSVNQSFDLNKVECIEKME